MKSCPDCGATLTAKAEFCQLCSWTTYPPKWHAYTPTFRTTAAEVKPKTDWFSTTLLCFALLWVFAGWSFLTPAAFPQVKQALLGALTSTNFPLLLGGTLLVTGAGMFFRYQIAYELARFFSLALIVFSAVLLPFTLSAAPEWSGTPILIATYGALQLWVLSEAA